MSQTNSVSKKSTGMAVVLAIMAAVLIIAVITVLTLTNNKQNVQPSDNNVIKENVIGAVAAPDNATASKLSAAGKENGDAKAWLYVPNTSIDNAVMFSKDSSFYKNKDELKKTTDDSAYYFDSTNKLGTRYDLSKITVIYGPNKDDNPQGQRFSQLLKFTDPSFASSAPCIYLSTASDRIAYRVFAAFLAQSSFHYTNTAAGDNEFMQMCMKANNISSILFGTDICKYDKMLILSTPATIDGKSGNFIVMARNIRKGETIPKNVQAKVNPYAAKFASGN